MIESILDTNKLDSTIRLNKTRIESTAKIFKKYDLVGKWSYNTSSYRKNIFAISEKGEWVDSYTSNSRFSANSIIKDDGEGLVFIMGWKTIKIDYPVIVNNCFTFRGRKNHSESFKMCRKS